MVRSVDAFGSPRVAKRRVVLRRAIAVGSSLLAGACGDASRQIEHPASTPCVADMTDVSRPAPAPEPTDAPVPDLLQPPVLSGFDCARAETKLLNECGAWGSHDWHPLPRELRVERGGGPEGVAWNPTFFACGAYIYRTCDGRANVLMHLGQLLVAEVRLPDNELEIGCRFGIDAETLKQAADAPSPSGEFEPIFTPVAFRIELTEHCEEPPFVKRSHDYFVSGFATGE